MEGRKYNMYKKALKDGCAAALAKKKTGTSKYKQDSATPTVTMVEQREEEYRNQYFSFIKEAWSLLPDYVHKSDPRRNCVFQDGENVHDLYDVVSRALSDFLLCGSSNLGHTIPLLSSAG